MNEEKPHKMLIRLVNISVLLGLLLWLIALWGFSKYQSNYESSTFGYITQALSRLKYQIIDIIAGTVIIILSVVINNTELKKVDKVNKPWDVKPPKFP